MSDSQTGAQVANGAKAMNAANTNQMSAALIVQTYSNSVLAQPKVDFGDVASLKSLETDLNNGLATAQTHANFYLNTLQPDLIQNMSDIGNYYQLNKALPATLPEGSTEQQWTEELNAVLQASQGYQASARKVVTELATFHEELSGDTQDFAGLVTKLNTTVNGDNGVLDQINAQLHKVQADIDGTIAGITISALAIAGGAFMICVGAIADFVTAGTSSGAVIGGIGIVAAGVAGEAASIAELVALSKEKAAMLGEEDQLKEEVKLAAAVSSGYSSLANQVKSALAAATAMENAWNGLISDLGNLISDINNGVLTADAVRTLFVTAANGEIATVLTDIDTIKGQMAGVTVLKATGTQTVTDVIQSAYKQAA